MSDIRGPDRTRRLLEHVLGVPVVTGNRVQVLRNGDEIFPAILAAISAATSSVELLTFIYWDGRIAQEVTDALTSAAHRGVRVRVLIDGFGAKDMSEELRGQLRRAGVVLEIFRPLRTWRVWTLNSRTHRRVLVCDGKVAFTGGVGISWQWSGDARTPREWRDTHFRVEGPAVVGLRGAFYTAWQETERPLVGACDTFPEWQPAGDIDVQVLSASSQIGWNEMALAFRALIGTSQRHVLISSAYFRPPALFVDLLCRTAGRGVDVDVLLPGPHTDRRLVQLQGEHSYEPLLRAGVRIWRYQPTMLHVKMLSVDGHVAMVGTANYDSRSIVLNEQVALVLHGEAITAEIDGQFHEDIARSLPVRLADWRRRGPLTRMKQRAAHVAGYALRGAGAAED